VDEGNFKKTKAPNAKQKGMGRLKKEAISRDSGQVSSIFGDRSGRIQKIILDNPSHKDSM
jgi:hypothetical protein